MDVNVPAAAEGRVALARSFAGAARRYWLERIPARVPRAPPPTGTGAADPRPAAARHRARRPAQVGQRRGRGRVRRVRASPPPGRGGARDDVLPGRLQLPGHALASSRARNRRPTAGGCTARCSLRWTRVRIRIRTRARTRRALRTPRTAPGTPTTTSTTPQRERRRLPDGDRRRLPRGARHTALLPDGRARGARGGRADRRVSERQHRRAIGRTRPERRGRPAGRPSGARALGPRADLPGERPALVGDRGRRRLLAVRLRADRPRGRARSRRLAGVASDGRGGAGRLLPLDRSAALAARQPGGRRRGPRHRTAQPDRVLCLHGGGRRAHGSAGRTLAVRAARALPDARAHTLLLAAMASFYLSTPEAATPRALPIARAVLGALDGPADLAMLVFRTRLRARGLLPGAEPGATSRRRTSGAEIVMPAQARQPEHRAATAQPARPVPRGETHAIK